MKTHPNFPDLIEIGPAAHPRDGAAGLLYRHAQTGAYTLNVDGAFRSFPPRDGQQIEHGHATTQPAGRPPEYGAAMEAHTIYTTAEQWQQVQERGGAEYIRRLIDTDRPQ